MCAAEEAKDGAAADMEEPKAAEADGAPSAAPPAKPGSSTGLGVWIKSVVGFFAMLFTVWALDYVLVKRMLAKRGASLLASYLAVNSTYEFAMSICSFVLLGSLPMLSKTSGEGDDVATGKVMRQTITLSAAVGTVLALVLSVFHAELLSLFKPRDEDESLVAGAPTMLLIQGTGFTFTVLSMGAASVAVALLQLYVLVVAGVAAYAFWIVAALVLYHNTNLGLPAFGVAVVFSYPIYFRVCDALLRGDAAQAARYGLDKGYVQAVSLDDARRFLTNISAVGVRSAFSTLRALLSPLAAIKLGVVEGSVYYLLLALQAPAIGLALGSGAINFFGARMIGAGEAKAFRWFAKDFSAFLVFWSVVAALLFLANGRGVVVDAARDDERAEYRDACTPFLWGIAVAILPLRLLSTIVDNVLLATQDFRVLGKLYFVGFSIYFAALAAAYRHFRSLAAVFFADFLFYFARGSLSLVYIRNVTFRRDPWWVARAPVDDPLDVYVAEMVGLLDTFGNSKFKRVFLCLLNSSALGKRWFVILVGIWRSMATDLQQASEVLATRRRSSLFRPKVRPS